MPFNHIKTNPVYNAFAYTDACIGRLVKRLKQSDLWDSLLVIFVADHGIPEPKGTSEAQPDMHHIPLFWCGGAIADRYTVVDDICSQADLAATLLSQLGLPVGRFSFSRDVLSPNYKYPYVFHTFPGGMTFIDSTGFTVYDLIENRTISEKSTHSKERIDKGKAYLQKMSEDFWSR